MSGMVGLDETLKELRTKCPTFKELMSGASFLQGATVMGVMINEMEAGLSSSSMGAKVIAGTSALSNMKQLYEFYSKTIGLADLQEKFVMAIPLTQVDSYLPNCNLANLNEAIIFNLKTLNFVTINLKNKDSFTLTSIPTTKLIGGSVCGVALSLVCAWVYIQSSSTVSADIPEMEKPLTEWLTLAGTVTPLVNFYDQAVKIFSGHTANLFEAISKTIKSYGPNIHHIPENLLEFAEFFMSQDYIIKNRIKIESLRNSKELDVLRAEMGLLSDKVKGLQLVANINEGDQKTMIWSDKASTAATSSLDEDEEAVGQETDQLLATSTINKKSSKRFN